MLSMADSNCNQSRTTVRPEDHLICRKLAHNTHGNGSSEIGFGLTNSFRNGVSLSCRLPRAVKCIGHFVRRDLEKPQFWPMTMCPLSLRNSGLCGRCVTRPAVSELRNLRPEVGISVSSAADFMS